MVSSIASQYFNKKAIGDDWSKAVLYQPHEAEQILIAENASCLAVKTYLNMCKLPYEIKQCPNAEFMSPGGHITKLPFICVGAFVIPELEQIVTFVENKGTSLTKNLDADDKHDMRAYISLTENIFSYAELYISWQDQKVLEEVTYKRNGAVYPWPLNHIQNWRKRRHFLNLLDVYEWKDLHIDEVVEKVEKCCETLCERLGDKEYFYGNSPTELDALTFGHIFSILTTKLPNNCLAETVNQFPALVEFCKRIENRYFGTESSKIVDSPKLKYQPDVYKLI